VLETTPELFIAVAHLKYFKAILPTAKDTGISEKVTGEANAALSQVLTE